MRTSWALGGATSMVSMLRSLPASHATAALQVMVWTRTARGQLTVSVDLCPLVLVTSLCDFRMPIGMT